VEQVLITGGAGFIGTNLADRLLRLGVRVTIYDNLARQGTAQNLDWLRAQHGARLTFIRGDVRDAAGVRAATGECDTVFHFAAQVAVTTSLTDPRRDFEVNALGTLNVLEAARQAPCPPAVFSLRPTKSTVIWPGSPWSRNRGAGRWRPTPRASTKAGRSTFTRPMVAPRAPPTSMCAIMRVSMACARWSFA
jgi:nucleoside-diphosphate-sugar epimerase